MWPNCSALAPRRPRPPPRPSRGVLVFLALPLMALLVTDRPSDAAALNGPAQVIDGNSIAVGGRTVRLFGIDAPDETQTCRRRGAEWRCGQDAGWALAAKIERHWVLCDTHAGPAGDAPETPDQPISAVCYMDGRRIDLSAWMVEQGWALADRRSDAYLAQEHAAQAAGRGLWSGTFQPPWEWRQQHR